MNITDVRIIRYALTLLRDFIETDPVNRVRYLTSPGKPPQTISSISSNSLHILPFLQLVGTSGSGTKILSTDADPYVLENAALCAAFMIAVDPSNETATSGMLAWILTNIKLFGSLLPRQVKVTEVATESLMILLRNEFIRTIFIEERGHERVVPMLTARNTQLLYDAIFCLWMLSLYRNTTQELERAGTTTAIARLCRSDMPLKVLRLSLSILSNITKNPLCTDSLADICETHVPEVVQSILNTDPPINDPELLEDARYLREAISTNSRHLTSFERYEKEINSRNLEWTVVHNSEFFKEHVMKMERDDFTIIRALGTLLQDTSISEVTTAVALHDLGEFAVYHPQGRSILTALGLRTLILSFLKRDEDDIKQQALLAASKLLVNRWQFVGQGVVSPK